ncbi:MAG: hypothetical protein GY717_06745 [Rhodobacteraceae bacterium]|nr:hypothetical protein [Paracoccaceae bacterium]
MRFRSSFFGAALVLGLAPALLQAAEVELRLQSSALSFSGGSGFSNAVLFVTGPNDFEVEETASRGLPVFRVQGGRIKDGFYHFTLSAATDEKVKIKRKVDNGRGADTRDYTLKPFHLSGMFEVRKGRIVPAEEMASGADGDPEEN